MLRIIKAHPQLKVKVLRMQRLVLAGERLAVPGGHFALLHAPLPADDDLRARLLLQGLQRVTAGPDDEADEVDLGVAVLWDQHLVRHPHLDGPVTTVCSGIGKSKVGKKPFFKY